MIIELNTNVHSTVYIHISLSDFHAQLKKIKRIFKIYGIKNEGIKLIQSNQQVKTSRARAHTQRKPIKTIFEFQQMMQLILFI